ncbi:MAG: hypothetical protein VB067_03380, partial [Christensenellaceae bacterium]|nr:hypothetical protein [Christensenellaceae bacterium]
MGANPAGTTCVVPADDASSRLYPTAPPSNAGRFLVIHTKPLGKSRFKSGGFSVFYEFSDQL